MQVTFSDREHISDFLMETGQESMECGEETFGGDEYIHYLLVVMVSQGYKYSNLSNCTL